MQKTLLLQNLFGLCCYHVKQHLWILFLILGLPCCLLAQHIPLEKPPQTPVQIGDPGWEWDPNRADPAYPAMQEWAKAGVEGGIPLRADLPIRWVLGPNESLQMAIDAVKKMGGGVIFLKKGIYELKQPIQVLSGVILRGEDKKGVEIRVYLKAPFFKNQVGKEPLTAISVTDAEKVGFEDLTIRYAAADFEPYDRSDPNGAWDRRIYHGPETRDTNLYVNLLIFWRSRNCWVDNCQFLWAGAHPLGAFRSEHLTFRNNFIDRAYIKQDSHHGGYYGCWGSKYCLFFNEKVSRIRHFALMNEGCKYNVVYACQFEVDVNFHSKDDGHNLVEACSIKTPNWHSWDAIAKGTPDKHGPPGPGNLLFNNIAQSKGHQGYTRKTGEYQLLSVYEVANTFDEPLVRLRSERAPMGATFYAVRRKK
jgi:hypothetical protein